MSWEYSRYEAKCATCGHTGVCIQGSHDWGRTSTNWEGFRTEDPDPMEVGRKRASRRDLTPICPCGSRGVRKRLLHD
jgi:hypothetical protein